MKKKTYALPTLEVLLLEPFDILTLSASNDPNQAGNPLDVNFNEFIFG